MDRLDDLAAFVAIIEKGSQTAAARDLRRSLQSINRSLTSLERGVGIALINRTTRQSTPTEAGLALYRRIKPALTEINDAKREAADKRAEPSGLLRVGAPVLFAPAFVAPVVCDFLERHPEVKVELKVSDRQVDLLEQGLDLAVRIREMPDSGLKARRIGELRVVIFGAPAYFARHGRPGHPDDLENHHCVLHAADDPDIEKWPFHIEGKYKSVRVHGRFKTDSAAAAHVAVARGLGVGRAPLWQIRRLVDDEVVEVVLEDFEITRIPIHAVWPSTKIPLAKTKLFADFLAARLKSADF
ncbi:LysR family transcriptional regulator [Rhizobium leguminosarum]|uniref:LysR family transcriptional regulator n=1 Tax=Rhizobium leguminosarum TaxID=384 RepID=UPI001C96B6F4|nr:LysR family transcriptional regulator [Rhizobium leguminosarum]MBY5408030.1 LysR family transcriptional regulator [Rhizobium leguminosarum]